MTSRTQTPGSGLRCVHRMRFGALPVHDDDRLGGYDFGLWAPAHERVEVVIIGDAGDKRYYACAEAAGWHRCRVDSARPGDRYLFRLGGDREVPDPASRFNAQDVHGPSVLTAPTDFAWDEDWRGRPWEETVVYELHVGTFTREGSFAAAEARLDEIASLGFTAIELMPIADFPGHRGWGYDGVLLFAPEAAYGTPDELKHFIQAAHRRRLMVFLDVVYNHFGPDGNYLHLYAPEFFTAAQQTPWGDAINFGGPASQTVRSFFINNALYWIEEFRFDGLRLDAVHAIRDTSQPHFLEELSQRVRAHALAAGRQVHLVIENVDNESRRLGPPAKAGRFDAQWNDDFHHAAHVLASGEDDSYYGDFGERPAAHLMRCLAEGFAFQGEQSAFHGQPRGQASGQLPASAFVNFLQNHDQIGNRAFGERLVTLVPGERLRALVALQLLAPSPPLVFMGEEAGATTPFLYFCDFPPGLARAVRQGRQREFAAFAQFSATLPLPDPGALATFVASRLDWAARETQSGRQWLAFYRQLLDLRHTLIIPRLPGLVLEGSALAADGQQAFAVSWRAMDGSRLIFCANLGEAVSPPFSALVSGYAALPEMPAFVSVGGSSDAPDRLGPLAVRAYLVPSPDIAT